MQKSLLTQNAPAELRGGIVSFDRLIQQVSKTTSTSIVGILLVSASLRRFFGFWAFLSVISVLLMAALLPSAKQLATKPVPRTNPHNPNSPQSINPKIPFNVRKP